ncbi:MAG: alkaline phosphatase D family protein, partial [Opitutaceae bacterium]|nr:alkaline phosphatase D family protein [Opitutaceae bacterium]
KYNKLMLHVKNAINSISALAIVSIVACGGCAQVGDEAVYLANGIKIGEVTQSNAIIWTRVTGAPEQLKSGVDFLVHEKKDILKFGGYSEEELAPGGGFGYQLPSGVKLEEAMHAVPGIAGEVRLTYFETAKKDAKIVTGWQPVDSNRDYTKHFLIENLVPETDYGLIVEARKSKSNPIFTKVNGSFTTAPEKDKSQKITFTVTTCTKYDWRDAGDMGHQIYDTMLGMKPDFFVHAGDIIYYDHLAPYVTHIDVARYKWNRMFGFPYLRDFLKETPSYFMKDDHDSWDNDCWPSMSGEMGHFTYEEGRTVYDEQVPMSDKRHFRTFRWGKDLQIWMVEVRDFRSPNFEPDGPDKTMWGKEQIEWFKRTVADSDATFKIVISPTPMVGPDHIWKGEMNDNHADLGWSHEGDMLREFIGNQKNMYYICGDRHWQYISRHPETGMVEYAVGASTNQHSTPLDNPDTAMHQYYRPHVGGFLSVTVDEISGTPTATFRHHGVNGDQYNEDIRVSEE